MPSSMTPSSCSPTGSRSLTPRTGIADGSFATAGKGVIDYGAYVAALRRAGFSGSLIAHGLAGGEARDVADFLKRKLDESEVA